MDDMAQEGGKGTLSQLTHSAEKSTQNGQNMKFSSREIKSIYTNCSFHHHSAINTNVNKSTWEKCCHVINDVHMVLATGNETGFYIFIAMVRHKE